MLRINLIWPSFAFSPDFTEYLKPVLIRHRRRPTCSDSVTKSSPDNQTAPATPITALPQSLPPEIREKILPKLRLLRVIQERIQVSTVYRADLPDYKLKYWIEKLECGHQHIAFDGIVAKRRNCSICAASTLAAIEGQCSPPTFEVAPLPQSILCGGVEGHAVKPRPGHVGTVRNCGFPYSVQRRNLERNPGNGRSKAGAGIKPGPHSYAPLPPKSEKEMPCQKKLIMTNALMLSPKKSSAALNDSHNGSAALSKTWTKKFATLNTSSSASKTKPANSNAKLNAVTDCRKPPTPLPPFAYPELTKQQKAKPGRKKAA